MIKMAGTLLGGWAVCMLAVHPAAAQLREEGKVQESIGVLHQIMAVPLNSIPKSMLADAQGVAIIPNVVKGSFVVGARHGKGVLLVRNDAGQWHAPMFVSLTGGNVGWQVGIQSSDIVLVFKTRLSIERMLSGKLTLGADVAAAAGPLGRQAGAATDGQLRAEIYSYSRSRGLFAGVSVDGSVLQVDELATRAYYRGGPGQPVQVPPAAQQLVNVVAAYSGSTPHAAQPRTQAMQQSRTEPDFIRSQLAQFAPQLYGVLNEQWKSYLALPPEVFAQGAHPSAQSLQQTLDRFEKVASDPRYRTLAGRAEFQTVRGLLRRYLQAQSNSTAKLELPPPPTTTR